MKFIGLVSGGKDSCYSICQLVALGHELIAVGNLHPNDRQQDEEADSHMFQTIGHELVKDIARSMRVPFYERALERNSSKHVELTYDAPIEGDEVEQLYNLIGDVKSAHPDVEAVASGAILSNYQRLRVEHVCQRHNLVSLAPLWEKDQPTLLQEMVTNGMDVILIKVASMGLDHKHLNVPLRQLAPYLLTLGPSGVNVCGEGGEYETFTLDCPRFYSRIVLDRVELIGDLTTTIAPVAMVRIKDWHLEDKGENYDPIAECKKMVNTALLTGGIEPIKLKDDELIQAAATSASSSASSLSSSSSSPALFTSFPSNDPEPIYPPANVVADHCFVAMRDETINHDGSLTDRLSDVLQQHSHTLTSLGFNPQTDIGYMELFLPRMSDFNTANIEYKRHVSQKRASSRACVELAAGRYFASHDDEPLVGPLGCDSITIRNRQRDVLHVQSISHWAPCCIGPYSQANKCNNLIWLAGQIGLHPITMKLAQRPRVQMDLAFRHVDAILRACKSDMSHAVSHVMYWCDSWVQANRAEFIELARDADQRCAKGTTMVHISVPQLPRGAICELQTIAQPISTALAMKSTTDSKLIQDEASSSPISPASICTTDSIMSVALMASMWSTIATEVAEEEEEPSSSDRTQRSANHLIALLHTMIEQVRLSLKKAKLK